MQDLNDLYYFVQVVRHGGFSAASRALRIPKSRLSRRITQLEEHLGVRLLQRTTRQLTLTDIGESFYRHCQEVVADAEAAQAAVEEARAEPHGQVRFGCPIALAQTLVVGALAEFMRRYPQIWVSITVTNDEVDMIREGLAVAIHSQLSSADDSSQVSRHLGNAQFLLVASPQYLDYQGRPQSPEALAGMDCLQSTYLFGRNEWPLTRADGATRTVSLRPRMEADELLVLKRAAMLGLGVMALPRLLCLDELESGLLEIVLPEWRLPTIYVHLSYPSRRGMVPAVRHFIDYMTERIPVLFTV